jgi:N-acetylmuramoyl-L-alanine amidase
MYEYEQLKQEQKFFTIIFALSIVCAALIFLAAGLNIYVLYMRGGRAVPVVLQGETETPPIYVKEIVEAEQELCLQSFLSAIIPSASVPERPLVALCWEADIFYDPITDTINLPPGVSVTSVSHNPAYYIHEIILDGVNLPRLNRLFMVYSRLLINIEQNGNTLNIRTRHGAAVQISPEGDYFRLVNLRDIYHTIVLIDPGHGGIDTGARNVLGRNFPQESEIVLAISQKLFEIFDEPGILLIPTRTEDVAVDNGVRFHLANRVADYFISIHANACNRSRNSRGTLTLYGRARGSAQLAYTLQNALAVALGSQNRGTEFSSEFRILNGSNVPVALLELLFMSNPDEARRLSDPATQTLIARTIADVIKGLEAR